MQRTVSSHLELTATAGTELVLSVAIARLDGYDRLEEDLRISADGDALEAREVRGDGGTLLHVLTVPHDADVVVDYRATVDGTAQPAPDDADARLVYLRPSRYVPSDRVLAPAAAAFAGFEGQRLLEEVTGWVRRNIAYVPGSSRVTDGAVETLLGRDGVCRDFAHLVLAFLRARDVPARLVSAYAPGLSPMDFHAVVEAYVEEEWRVVDATGLAPRQSLLRIATGRDAADTAFLSSYGGRVSFTGLSVTAIVAPGLPDDDGVSPVLLG